MAKNVGAANIHDRLSNAIEDGLPRRALYPNAVGLPVLGFRIRIKGRPKGEEMAVKHDFMKGSCPKKDTEAWIDYGKHSIKLKNGLVGIKAWVHYQRPCREDETGQLEREHNLFDIESASLTSRLLSADEDLNANAKQSLLTLDRDYDPAEFENCDKEEETTGKGLWNVCSPNDPQIASLVGKLRRLHTPDFPSHSRFIW